MCRRGKTVEGVAHALVKPLVPREEAAKSLQVFGVGQFTVYQQQRRLDEGVNLCRVCNEDIINPDNQAQR